MSSVVAMPQPDEMPPMRALRQTIEAAAYELVQREPTGGNVKFVQSLFEPIELSRQRVEAQIRELQERRIS